MGQHDGKTIESQVLSAIAEQRLWAPGDRVVVAVSGGADSLCLLHLLHTQGSRHGGLLHVAHFDHRLRPESGAEAAYVSAVAQRWGLPFTLGSEDVPARIARERLSPEDAARRARYRFLLRLAANLGASAVALGHTREDQVETILMHLLRGTGLSGLRGMRMAAPPAPWMVEGLDLPRPIRLVRPLLEVSRAETQRYCREHGLAPIQDAWNEEERFLRVRLRRQVLPLLRSLNPRLDEALLRLARLAAWLETDLEQLLDARWPELASETGRVIRLSLGAYRALPWTLRLEAVRRAAERIRGHLEDIGWDAIVAAAHLDEAAVGSQVSLVEGLVARREYEALAVGEASALEAGVWPDLGPHPVPLAIPGRTLLPEGHSLTASFHSPEERPAWERVEPHEAWLDADACGSRLWLRHPRPGDRFRPLGLGGTKKLHDWAVDEKVPRTERRRIPLVVSPRGIVWIVGYRIDERFAIRPTTRRLLHLRWE
ncbi:MAG: tRNA lysidine(34) synthetase TilS [Chloroflexia bacterium]